MLKNNMSQLEPNVAGTRSEGFIIDYKRIAYRALQYWYLVVLSLALGLTYAYFKNRWATRIYPVTASVIIRENQEGSGGDLLYKNSLIDPYRNYLNEPYIIRSYPIVGSVIEKLNFEVAFYQQGTIKTTEAYGLPVKARLLKRNGSYGATLIFKAIDDQNYLIQEPVSEKHDKGKNFKFNDSIHYLGHHFIVTKDDLQNIDGIKNIPYLLTFLDPISVTGSYVG